MSIWNYVATVQKATYGVTHSCVGSFTSPHDINLIIAKRSRIEIHLFTPQGLKPLLDVPIYGRIATLELFRSHGEPRDSLFLSTEKYKFCVLQWDMQAGELITKAIGDLSNRMRRPIEGGQIGTIDPDCRLIGLHSYVGAFDLMPFDSEGQLQESFNIRLDELQVLDIKFLYGCSEPTVAVLYQDNRERRHLKTYMVDLRNKEFNEGLWSKRNLDYGAALLIPVPMPLGGVIVIGDETICYCSASVYKEIRTTPNSMTKTNAYGRVDADGSRYLLGDLSGQLHLLVITHKSERVTGLKLELLGETSIASTISYLDSGIVYIGSSYGDSQLIKLHWQMLETGM
jgi:DNA damage-binding protein 1